MQGFSGNRQNHNWLGSSRFDFWQEKNYHIIDWSRYSKLGENWIFSVVQFHLLQSTVQVTTWWWSKSSSGYKRNFKSLRLPKGLCINFIDRGALFWVVPVDLLVVLATHKFTPSLLECLWVGLSSNRRSVLGTIYCRHCHQLFIQLGWNSWLL